MKIPSTVRIFVVLFLMCTSHIMKGQNVLWAKKGISEGFENGNAIVTDDSGNVYVTGQFEFTSVFENVILKTYGQHDIFVAKYGTDGSLKWIRQAGGPSGDIGNGIGIDAQHNVYITGEFEDTVKFGAIKKVTSGGNDGFIAKYDPNGNIIWVKDFGCPTSSDKGRALAVTPAGDIYITGNFSVTSNFSGKTLSSAGGNDIFIVKYNTNGDIVWAKKAGGTHQDRGYGITVDASENVFVTGTFSQSATFNNVTVTNPANNSSFLAKYDSSGQFKWVRESGACCDTTKSNSVALDEKGNIFITGYFMEGTRFDSTQLLASDTSDIFIVKYDPTGKVLWAKQAGGPDEDASYGIVVDTLNHLAYITGLVRDRGYFDSLSYRIVGYKDVFIAAYDMDGKAVWVKTYGGHYRDVGAAIAVDPKGYIYSTGLFNDSAQFGDFALIGYPNQPWADFYVNKISPAMASLPTIASTSLTVNSGRCSDLQLSFTSGNGNKRIVVVHEGSPVNSVPQNGASYLSDSFFGNGSKLGTDNYVVYNGTGNNVTVTNLTPGATYYFSVFEYNGFGIASSFLTNNPATGFATTVIYPLNLTSSKNTICDGESIDLSASGATTYSWLPLNDIINISDSVVSAIPHTTTTYIVSGKNRDGCFAEAKITINVNPLPVVSFSSLTPVCMNNPEIILSGGAPSGGVYSGSGVSGNQFSPMMAGSGIIPLFYEYTDANGCKSKSETSIDVYPMPGAVLSSIPSICENESPIVLNNGMPSGGTYTGAGLTGRTFDPSIGEGTYQITYTVSTSHGCSESVSNSIEVKPAPSLDLGRDIILCEGNSTTLNAGTSFSTYSWSTGETTSSIVVDSSGVGLGTKNIFLIVGNSSSCKTSDIIQIRFDLCAGINESTTEFKNISVSPNPFNNKITISSEKQISICIYDICGKLIDKRENVFGKIDLGENLNRGVYFIDVTSGSNKKVFTVMKSGL